jgi:hypothetical protein
MLESRIIINVKIFFGEKTWNEELNGICSVIFLPRRRLSHNSPENALKRFTGQRRLQTKAKLGFLTQTMSRSKLWNYGEI